MDTGLGIQSVNGLSGLPVVDMDQSNICLSLLHLSIFYRKPAFQCMIAS